MQRYAKSFTPNAHLQGVVPGHFIYRAPRLAPLQLDDRAIAKQEIIDLLQPILMEETGSWIADYVQLRFKAKFTGLTRPLVLFLLARNRDQEGGPATMSTDTDVLGGGAAVSPAARWVQLVLGLVCMMAISSPQYVWALFTKPLGAALSVTPAALQVTFSLLIVLQTFFSPLQGWLVDRFGPRLLIAVGGALSGLGWVLSAYATSIWALYFTYGVICGLGTGIVYIGVVGQVVRWFPDARGFAAGMVAAGYGMGAIVTTFPISASLAASGYQATLQQYGIIFAIVGVAAALGLRPPPPAASTRIASASGVGSATMLRSPIFWLMFLMMSLMSTSGLMVISQIGNFAADFGVTKLTLWGAAALPLALTIDRFTNGLTRPFFGWLSDRIGRENTMFCAFALEAAAMTIWLLTITDPLWFALLSGVVFFGWGEIFSLFPSTLTDTFGARNATQNYGFLYIAQGIGSIFGGPLAALLHQSTGSWTTVFAVCIGADITAALLAMFALKPMRRAALEARSS